MRIKMTTEPIRDGSSVTLNAAPRRERSQARVNAE